jgi:hypothetical protein
MMVNSCSINNIPATASHFLLTEELRYQLGLTPLGCGVKREPESGPEFVESSGLGVARRVGFKSAARCLADNGWARRLEADGVGAERRPQEAVAVRN